jgi:exosortase/archaeosortase family protein
MPTAALWIAIAAFPAPWRWKVGGLLAGAGLLWLYNMARILALVPVLAYRPQIFDFIHVYLWQTVTLLVVFALFLLWLKLQQPKVARA